VLELEIVAERRDERLNVTIAISGQGLVAFRPARLRRQSRRAIQPPLPRPMEVRPSAAAAAPRRGRRTGPRQSGCSCQSAGPALEPSGASRLQRGKDHTDHRPNGKERGTPARAWRDFAMRPRPRSLGFCAKSLAAKGGTIRSLERYRPSKVAKSGEMPDV
jgi:hypothetical protein